MIPPPRPPAIQKHGKGKIVAENRGRPGGMRFPADRGDLSHPDGTTERQMRTSLQLMITGLLAGLLAPGGPALAQDVETRSSEAGLLRVVTVAKGLENPWALQFLPDGRMLVTERPGRIRIVARDGSLSAPLANVPEVFASGQGGLLDLHLDPDFASSRRLYFSYAEPGEGG